MTTKKEETTKPWGGRFQEATDSMVEDFTASVHYDQRLYRQDIKGSKAHARMLARQGIIAQEDAEATVNGLDAIEEEISTGKFTWKKELEDVHMNIERALVERVGEAGKRLHTARSRNDQVATDVRLYLREEIDRLDQLLKKLQMALLGQAEKYKDLIIPGYTHLQRAQPVLWAHHMMAYFEMFKRDRQRLMDCRKRVNICPLGSAALAGTEFPIDREWVARELGFDAICANSMDGVADRDFIVEFLSAASLVMVHLSRLAEELILWASTEFSFVELPDSFCTGSSIMPQKKNPDVMELVRGKTGRVFGHLFSLLTILKGLPMTYNRDLQEDKEPLFDTIDTVSASVAVTAALIDRMKPRKEILAQASTSGYLTATDLADYLVTKGVPFREAHSIVGKAVAYCIEKKKDLSQCSLDELKEFSPLIDEDVFQVLTLEGSVSSRKSPGGTSHERVSQAIDAARRWLEE